MTFAAPAASSARPAPLSASPAMTLQRRELAALNYSRKQAGVSLSALLTEAGLHIETYYDALAGRRFSRPATIARLWAALERLRAGRAAPPPAAIKGLVLAAEEILRARVRGSLVAACNTQYRGRGVARLPEQRLRTLAIYLVAVEVEIENVDIGRALGCSRQNVKKARDTIEALRDDDNVDRLLTECGQILTGRS